jgi:hypothetical protein
VSVTAGSSLLAYAVLQAGSRLWGTIGAAVLLGYFVVHERFVASSPLMPVALWRSGPVTAAASVGARRRGRLKPAPERRDPARGHRLRLRGDRRPGLRPGHGLDVLSGQATAVFRRGLPFGEATWARARGWALWKALVTLSGAQQGGDGGQAAARRFGWRYNPRQIIGRVIAGPYVVEPRVGDRTGQ